MSTALIRAATRAVGGVLVLALGIAGCRLGTAGQADPVRTIPLPPGRPSALVLIVDPAFPGAAAAVEALLVATARPGERLFLFDMASGALLESGRAPRAPAVRVPGPPAPLPRDATPFQRSRHLRGLASYEVTVGGGRAELLSDEQHLLAAWAASAAGQVARAGARQPAMQDAGLPATLRAAAADLSSLQQAGVDLSARKVITILGPDRTSAALAPSLRSGLAGSTVAVGGFPGNGDDEAAWQASLLQAGAARAVILTPATDGQLTDVITEGLDGAVSVPLTHVWFALGSYQLGQSAVPALDYVLGLLTGRYAQAIATIDGYTDDLPTPGGNHRLSLERALAVQAWLVGHGVAPSRLQANGYGDADPVVPNQPGGQPLNRRVVVVIDPAVQTQGP
jgi:outer membrane protein OmpA-like peptidoglycan-associated protein